MCSHLNPRGLHTLRVSCFRNNLHISVLGKMPAMQQDAQLLQPIHAQSLHSTAHHSTMHCAIQGATFALLPYCERQVSVSPITMLVPEHDRV